MDKWGKAMYVTPGVVVDGQLVTNNLVDINLGIRILLGSSYYDGWENEEMFVTTDPLGNPVDRNHPWNQTTTPRPQKRDFKGNYSWVMSPRWYDKRTGDYLALDTGGGPIARFWATALAGIVDIGYIKATGHSVKIYLPKTANLPETELEWKIPKWSNAIERDRARTYFQAYAAACALYFAERAMAALHAGKTKTFSDFKVPDEAIGCGFHEAVRGVLSHHVVIREGKIANYHPYPPTPWNANPRDIYGTPGPLRGCGAEHADLRRKRTGELQGHRYHARCAQLRSLPPLRRSYVPWKREEAGSSALADVRRAGALIAMATADRELAERIEELVLRVGNIPDPESREAARQLMASILELHGAGIERMMEITSAAGDPGQALIRRFAGDNLVAALLLLHNLHPDDLETRVQHALGKWHGSAELVGEFEGVVRVRLSARRMRGEGSRGGGYSRGRVRTPMEIVIEESFQTGRFRASGGTGNEHFGGGLDWRRLAPAIRSASRCGRAMRFVRCVPVRRTHIHQFEPRGPPHPLRMRTVCAPCRRVAGDSAERAWSSRLSDDRRSMGRSDDSYLTGVLLVLHSGGPRNGILSRTRRGG